MKNSSLALYPQNQEGKMNPIDMANFSSHVNMLFKVIGANVSGMAPKISPNVSLKSIPITFSSKPLNGLQEPFVYKQIFPNIIDFHPHFAPCSINHNSQIAPPFPPEFRIIPEEVNEFNINKISVNAYKRRNVYKSIIRHMFKYAKLNKGKITSLLKTSGYTELEIEEGFKHIIHLNSINKQKGMEKRPQYEIKKLLEVKSVPTYFLKETLSLMLKEWESGESGRLMKKNVKVYKKVCTAYYNHCKMLIDDIPKYTNLPKD